MSAERDAKERATGSRLARLVDGLIPPALHADPDIQLRSRVLVVASFGLGVLTLAILVVRVVTVPPSLSVLLTAVVVAVMLTLPLVQRATRSHRIAGGLLVGVCLVVLPTLHLLRGVFPDATVALFAVVPLIASFFVGPRAGYVSAAILTATTVALQAVLVAPEAAHVVRFWSTYVTIIAVAPIMTAVLAAAYERGRARTQSRLAASNLALAAASARADAANRGKTDFLRHISHELRTPLNAILGYGELVLDQLRDEGNPIAADVEKIRGASEQLLGLINDMLDISRIEAGAIDIVSAEVDPHALLLQVRDTALPLAAVRHNTLVLDVPDALPRLWTDEQRLRQILLNLVSNACKFTDRGRVILSAAATAEHMRLRVRDTGVGLSPEECARIFEPFVQVHESLERRRQGSGLGLTLSRELALRLDGDITVTSEPGRGSEFTVVLPLRPPAPRPR